MEMDMFLGGNRDIAVNATASWAGRCENKDVEFKECVAGRIGDLSFYFCK